MFELCFALFWLGSRTLDLKLNCEVKVMSLKGYENQQLTDPTVYPKPDVSNSSVA